MPIVQNIPRKQGRIFKRPASQATKLGSRIFPPNYTTPANVGDVLNPGNPAYLTLAGLDYNNRISKTGGAMNPLGTQRDTATQGWYPIMLPVGTVGNVPQADVPEVGLHEKGTFFPSQKPLNTTPTRVSGGVSPTSDSAFHPTMAMANRPRRYPTPAGERTHAESFGSRHTLSAKPEMDVTGSRWSRIKRSASDVPLPTFLVPQTARQVQGTAGWIESTSREPVQNQSHIGGGGFGSPWATINRPMVPRFSQTPQYAAGGPGATPSPFPQKLGCKKGCK